jgi:hypothetical protein
VDGAVLFDGLPDFTDNAGTVGADPAGREVQRQDTVGQEPVVPLRRAIGVLSGQVVGARVDLGGHPGLLPPGVDRGNEGPIAVEQARVEHRPRQVRSQDQVTEVRLGHRPHPIPHLGERPAEQSRTG